MDQAPCTTRLGLPGRPLLRAEGELWVVVEQEGAAIAQVQIKPRLRDIATVSHSVILDELILQNWPILRFKG